MTRGERESILATMACQALVDEDVEISASEDTSKVF